MVWKVARPHEPLSWERFDRWYMGGQCFVGRWAASRGRGSRGPTPIELNVIDMYSNGILTQVGLYFGGRRKRGGV